MREAIEEVPAPAPVSEPAPDHGRQAAPAATAGTTQPAPPAATRAGAGERRSAPVRRRATVPRPRGGAEERAYPGARDERAVAPAPRRVAAEPADAAADRSHPAERVAAHPAPADPAPDLGHGDASGAAPGGGGSAAGWALLFAVVILARAPAGAGRLWLAPARGQPIVFASLLERPG